MSINVSTLALHSRSSRKVTGEPYLRFQVTAGMVAVLSMRQVQEVRILPAHRLTPMPNMPAPVLGLMNHRSRVRWVLDIAQLLGLAPLESNQQQYELLLLQMNTIALGLAVQRIESTTWFPASTMQPLPEEIPPALVPYLQGCVVQEQSVLWVLNPEAIVHLAMQLCE